MLTVLLSGKMQSKEFVGKETGMNMKVKFHVDFPHLGFKKRTEKEKKNNAIYITQNYR